MHDSVVKYHSDTYQDCFGVEFVWFLGTVTDTQRCRSAPHPQVSTGDHRRGTQRTGTANMMTPICGVDGPGRMLWILWYTRDQCRTVVFVVRFATECSPEKNHCRPTCGPIQVSGRMDATTLVVRRPSVRAANWKRTNVSIPGRNHSCVQKQVAPVGLHTQIGTVLTIPVPHWSE